MKTRLLKKLRRRFVNHFEYAPERFSNSYSEKIYCYDKKYKHNGSIIENGRFIEALHDYYVSAINYYRYINPPLWLIIKNRIREWKLNKKARACALRKYKIYYE